MLVEKALVTKKYQLWLELEGGWKEKRNLKCWDEGLVRYAAQFPWDIIHFGGKELRTLIKQTSSGKECPWKIVQAHSKRHFPLPDDGTMSPGSSVGPEKVLRAMTWGSCLIIARGPFLRGVLLKSCLSAGRKQNLLALDTLTAYESYHP